MLGKGRVFWANFLLCLIGSGLLFFSGFRYFHNSDIRGFSIDDLPSYATDESGKLFTRDSIKGKAVLIYFRGQFFAFLYGLEKKGGSGQ
jgi:cytochrome oxidase Cu insertion factor (SCO1/SenC/PrrC family)